MDPNQTYKTLRYHVTELIEQLAECESWGENSEIIDTADTVAEAFDALDGWLRKGGDLPYSWRNAK